MCANKIITPEVILQKLTDRLRSKKYELEYLMYMDKQFEKWIQCELILAMNENKRKLIPIAFDKKGKEIKTDGENICDITIEYTFEKSRKKYRKRQRSDVIITEMPFLYQHVNKDWEILTENSIKSCRHAYLLENYHYVELKHYSWCDIKNRNHIADVASIIVKDLRKYPKKLQSKFLKAYNPSTAISIICIAFYNHDHKTKTLNKNEIKKAIKKIYNEAKNKSKNNYSFQEQLITDEIYLLMTVYKYKNE